MLAFDQNTWTTEQEMPTELRRQAGADELDRDRLSRAAAPDPDEEDELDDDLDLDEDDDDLDLDEDDEVLDDDLDADVVPDYGDEEDDDLDEPIRAEIQEDEGHIENGSDLNDPDEIPGREEAANEDLGAPSEQDIRTPQEGNDASYSEQTDVTPPRTHEFPSEGNPKTDFSARPHGRTTGRMVGHEPGTEGI